MYFIYSPLKIYTQTLYLLNLKFNFYIYYVNTEHQEEISALGQENPVKCN